MSRFSKLIMLFVCLVAIAVPFVRDKLKARHYVAQLTSGVILAATPRNRGPFFKNTQVLLIDYLPKGATGVVLSESIDDGIKRYENATSNLALNERSNALSRNKEQRASLFWGGPVAQSHVFQVSYNLKTDELKMAGAPFDNMQGSPDIAVATFKGYAGWGEGQLPREIIKGDWRVYSVDPQKISEWLTVSDRTNRELIDNKHAEE